MSDLSEVHPSQLKRLDGSQTGKTWLPREHPVGTIVEPAFLKRLGLVVAHTETLCRVLWLEPAPTVRIIASQQPSYYVHHVKPSYLKAQERKMREACSR